MRSFQFLSLFSLLIFSVILFSCGPQNKEQQVLMDEVMTVHDEVMPKMDDIMAKTNLIADKVQVLKADSVDNTKKIVELAKGSLALKKADDAMMDWMRNYKPPSSDKTHEEAMAYLNGEKVKITAIKEQILTTLAAVDKLLTD